MNISKKIYIVFAFCAIIIGILIIVFSLNKTCRSIYEIAKIYKNGKHLVLFQNNAEIRPTGGFIGSFAVVDTKNFRITNIYFDPNIYKRDNEFVIKNNYVPKDEVLKNFLDQGKLEMRDSNWSLDFSDAAREIAWFYEHEGGSKVDTVTAIDTEFFKKILNIIGPIKMVKYDTTIVSDNFNKILENEIENKYTQSEENIAVNEPKSIISDMMPIVLSRIKNISHIQSTISAFFGSLDTKNILIYSFEGSLQKTIDKNNWGGHIDDSNNDYLYINNANLGGFKTNIDISEDITYEIKKNSEDIYVSVLTIQKEFPQINDCELSKNFTRVLVPYNSTLLSASNNDTDITGDIGTEKEYQKTVFRFWSSINCSQNLTYKLIYTSPQDIFSTDYSLVFQKQPGAINQSLKIIFEGDTLYEGAFDKDLTVHLP